MNEYANRLARRLIEKGVQPGALVGISLGRSVETVIALLGILKTGAAYVPLDPAYPEQRLDFMVEDSKVSIVVTTPAFSDLWQKHRVEHIAIRCRESCDWQRGYRQPVGARVG